MSGLNLTPDTVIPYLNFFFLNVRHEEGEIIVLKNPEEASTIDLYDDERREDINLQPEHAVIEQNESGSFIVKTPIFLDGGLINAQMTIDRMGHVIVKSLGMMTSGHLQ
jgi:hypothetical protein